MTTTTQYPIGSEIECVWPGDMRRRYTVRAQSQDGRVLYCAGTDGAMRRVELDTEAYRVEAVADATLFEGPQAAAHEQE